jgi:ubiquinol-cytochrome c reductase cytochrome c subunit
MLLTPGVALCQPPESGAAPDGAAIFARHCAVCHGDKGQGISSMISIAGPSLQAEHNHGMVMMAVETGPSHMPSFARILTVPEIRSVARFVTQQIAVIPLAGGNLSDGGVLFRKNCAECHRTAVRGGALVFTGINAPALVGKSPALVAGAIRWGPGPMPPFPRSIMTDQQLASIVDYVMFAQNPPRPGGIPLHFYGPVAEGFAGGVGVLVLIFFVIWIERGGRG